MNIQKTLLGAIAGLIGLFGSGYLIYIALTSPTQFTTESADAVSRTYFPGIITMEFLFGMLLTMLFQQRTGINTFMSGLKAGAVIGLFLGLCLGLWLYSTTTMYESHIVWWYGLTFAIRFGVAGGLIGIVLGKE